MRRRAGTELTSVRGGSWGGTGRDSFANEQKPTEKSITLDGGGEGEAEAGRRNGVEMTLEREGGSRENGGNEEGEREGKSKLWVRMR